MENLFNLIPKKYFVGNLKQNTLGNIKIALVREVTGNLIIRSNYADETITFKTSNEKDVIEIPARKLKSREKLLGLKICRQYNAVDEDLRYNVIKKSEQLANPNSIVFGDSVTESNDAVGIKSRVIYDWAYSLRDVSELTATLQHNALSEGGTMYNEEEGKLRQSLFQVQYIKPNTYFPHFVSIENCTPELLIHLLFCILYENRYGAQSTTLGANMQNHIVGIGFDMFEKPINSFTISKNWDSSIVPTLANVTETVQKTMQAQYSEGHYCNGQPLVDMINQLWGNDTQLQTIYAQAVKDCTQFLKDIKVIKPSKSK